MITSLDIKSKEVLATIESSKVELTEKLASEYSYKKNYHDISMTMSCSTYNECNSELHAMFGDILDDIVIILPDSKYDFGVVDLTIKDMTTNSTVSYNRYYLFCKEKTYDLTELKDDIIAKSPEFLIINMSTWGLINNLDFDNIDKYGNQVDYYHSYCKIPVALSEFVNSGQVLLVK